MKQAQLRIVDQAEQPDRTRVCDISFRRDDQHEARCIVAIRRREHPAWSQHAVSWRVTALRGCRSMAEPFDRIYVGGCYHCKEPMWMIRSTYETLQRSGAGFKCLWGHSQVFTAGKTEAQRLRDELDAERRRRQSAEQNVEFHSQMQKRAEASARGYKGVATKLKNRARAGVCPCCKRTFKQLAAHMANKHPEFSANPDGDLPVDTPPILSVVEGGKA